MARLKPGYNVKLTNGQYVLAYDIFPNPTDTRTLKPFLQSIQTLDLFQNIVADAGYGSEENYSFIIDELEKSPLIPYGMYQKELTKKYKTVLLIQIIGTTLKKQTNSLNQMVLFIPLNITLVEKISMALNGISRFMRQKKYKARKSWKNFPKQKVVARNRSITIQLGITLKNS
ncbi:transposase [Streptococcus iniae]